MNRRKILASMLAASMLLGVPSICANAETSQYGSYTAVEAQPVDELYASDAQDFSKDITDAFSIISETSGGYTYDAGIYTITSGGEYNLSGKLEGSIVINAADQEVTLMLSDCSISSSVSAPIVCLDAKKLTVSAQSDTYNEIIDSREYTPDTDSGDITSVNAGAAIYSSCDLTVKGHGALEVAASYNNGIASSDKLTIKNLTLKVTAYNNALKGRDGISVESGNIIAIASTGDGLETENSGLSEKGNQKGIVDISGGTINIYAARDGISAASDIIMSGDGYVSIYTDTYSDYSEEGRKGSSSAVYLILSTSDYNNSLDYYAYFSKVSTAEGRFVKADSIITVYGGRTMYYGLAVQQPAGYDHILFAACASGAEISEENYELSSQNMSINTSKNAFLASVSSDSVSGDWVTLSTDSSGKNGKEYSTKGIKADNTITIAGNITVLINSTDDAVHVNASAALKSGETGKGSFVMNGGRVQLKAGDDAIHADKELTINGGSILIDTSYEGLEASQITINGGNTHIYATDDAVNASNGSFKGMNTPLITVNGGYLEVQTPSGDTDAIDSNGSYMQTGGFVVVRGGSTMGSVAGSVDVDGSITVNGGCIVACGGVCETPGGSCNAYVSSGTALSSGEYTLKDTNGNTIISFTLSSSHSGIWISCDALTAGAEYVLTADQNTILQWTQESGTMGSSYGGFGFGGGFPGGGKPGGGMPGGGMSGGGMPGGAYPGGKGF